MKSLMFKFCDCKDVLELDTSMDEDMYWCFYNSWSLHSLDLTSWNVSNVKTMDHCFCNCMSLCTLDVSNWNTSSLENM